MPPYNILAQRIIWSGICMAIAVFGLHFKQFKKRLSLLKRTRLTTIPTVGSISHHQRKLVYLHLGHRQQPSYDTSLGYYINPLFNVVLGVILFKEVLSVPKAKRLIATIGIALLTYQGILAVSVDDSRRFLRSLWGR